MIKIENLSIQYMKNQDALSSINLTLENGHIYGLVGSNGAGKSTLFKAILGYIKQTNGTITIAEKTVKSALKSNLISYIPQNENVDWNFPILVKDVVMMGRYGYMGFLRLPSKDDHKATEEALRKVDLWDLKDRQIGALSGGQKKRVFVARALAQKSPIILLDEPFNGVDIRTESALIKLFQALAKDGKLILVSTHNLGSVPSFCESVILLKRKIIAFGTIQKAFTQDNLAKTFGGMLRHLQLISSDLHDDEDGRSMTVLTDDERPLVLYGHPETPDIVVADHEANHHHHYDDEAQTSASNTHHSTRDNDSHPRKTNAPSKIKNAASPSKTKNTQ